MMGKGKMKDGIRVSVFHFFFQIRAGRVFSADFPSWTVHTGPPSRPVDVQGPTAAEAARLEEVAQAVEGDRYAPHAAKRTYEGQL